MHITRRELHIGPHTLASEHDDKGAAPYLLSGPHMYVVGRGSGDLAPLPSAHHIPNEMGGVWAHPLKVAEGVLASLCDAEGAPLEAADAAFEERLSDVAWRWRAGELQVERRDVVAPIARPALLSHISLHNAGDAPFAGELHIAVDLKFVPAWRSGLRSGGGAYGVEGAWLLGRDRAAPERWGVACGTGEAPARYRLEGRGPGCAATLVYHVALKPGERREWHFALAAESERGADAARHTCAALVKEGTALFAQQQQAYGSYALHAEADSEGLTRDVDLAQANLRLLHADYPALGAYFLAGLPEYPQLFGCDTTYSVAGALAAGFVDVTRNALRRLAEVAQAGCARFPHELTTNGRVFHPGNVQETPQFVIACWDFVRWTGDLAFGRELLPLCREALDEFVAMASWPDGLYPYGDGMVERLGMGGRKLDSACYHYAALLALADLCEALGEEGAAYRERAAALKGRFAEDWWLEDEGLYADSMDADGTRHFDGHWTVALPLQFGLAEGERAARMWGRIEAEWVNEWGLIHTREAEPLVWTLPTGLLALAAFEHGRAALGLKLVENIALTARVGTLGTFKELIPEGMCFVQLWSAGLYLQGVVEGLFGVRPLAHQHRVELRPCLPDAWGRAALRGVRVGEHTINLVAENAALLLEHVSGPGPLVVAHGGAEATVEVGGREQFAPGASQVR